LKAVVEIDERTGSTNSCPRGFNGIKIRAPSPAANVLGLDS